MSDGACSSPRRSRAARRVSAAALAAAVLILSAAPKGALSETDRRRILEHSPLGPPPPDPSNSVADDERAARLGQALFFDERLAGAGVSCATCHDPRKGFTDGKPVSEGVGRGRRHTMTLWNVAYGRWFFWDGRADSLWSQALVPMESETEMGGNRVAIVRHVATDLRLRAAYEAVFGVPPDLSLASRFPVAARPVPSRPDDPQSLAWAGMEERDRVLVDRAFTNLGKAIAAYERRLVSRHSPFDRFVEEIHAGGKGTALSPSARRGLELFLGRGNCRICHGGPNFTDREFHNTGVPPADRNALPDPGRYAGIDRVLESPFNLTGRYPDVQSEAAGEMLRLLRRSPETWGQFKTPTLRNVARTAPYMHQGQLPTLRDVLRFYSMLAGTADAGPSRERILVPLRLSAEETDDLVAFLESLTDEAIDPALLAPPAGGISRADGKGDALPLPAKRRPISLTAAPDGRTNELP